MRFPWISRAHHQDLMEALKTQLAERERRLSALELDHKRLLDSIFRTNFGTQVYGTIAEQMPASEPETPETDLERQAREFREAHESDVARVKSAMRLSPSKVGSLLEEIRRRDELTKLQPAKIAG